MLVPAEFEPVAPVELLAPVEPPLVTEPVEVPEAPALEELFPAVDAAVELPAVVDEP